MEADLPLELSMVEVEHPVAIRQEAYVAQGPIAPGKGMESFAPLGPDFFRGLFLRAARLHSQRIRLVVRQIRNCRSGTLARPSP